MANEPLSLSKANVRTLKQALNSVATNGRCAKADLVWLKREGLVGGTAGQSHITAKGHRIRQVLQCHEACQSKRSRLDSDGGESAGTEDVAIQLPDVLDRLARPRKDESRLLDAPHVAAARKFQVDLSRSGLRQRTTQSWSLASMARGGKGAGSPVSQEPVAMLDARDRVNKACVFVGPELSGLLIDICLYEKSLEIVEQERHWPKRSGKVVVSVALNALARYYGLTTAA
ncbi:MAG: DUF6456 domain-containing protein [Pseudomonadota bacterium]